MVYGTPQDTFTTAVPCRIIHDSKAEAPSLKIPDLEPYQTALARLKAHQVDCNHKAGFLDENRERSLKDVVNEALGIFRDERFPIAIASGVQEVVRQVSVLTEAPLTMLNNPSSCTTIIP